MGLIDSPIVVAILVFLGIYFTFFVIRLFADFILVSIALLCAGFTYYFLSDPETYHTIVEFSKELPIFSTLLQALPDQLEQLEQSAIIVIATSMGAFAVLLSIPFLPFSAAYRFMFGIENPVFQRKESKVRGWIIEEIQRYHQQREFQRKRQRETQPNKSEQ